MNQVKTKTPKNKQTSKGWFRFKGSDVCHKAVDLFADSYEAVTSEKLRKEDASSKFFEMCSKKYLEERKASN